jgi:hypothetical protein
VSACARTPMLCTRGTRACAGRCGWGRGPVRSGSSISGSRAPPAAVASAQTLARMRIPRFGHPVTKIGFNAALNALTVIGLFAE